MIRAARLGGGSDKNLAGVPALRFVMRRVNQFFFPVVLPIILPAALALAGLASTALTARAAQDPLVIPGIGPAEMARPSDRAEQRPQTGAYGGGFIDFVVTGYSGAGARYNMPGQAPPAAYEIGRAHV